MRYKPAPRFRHGFLLPDGLSPRRTRVGKLIPQPRVATADGVEKKLDHVLGNRFALLACGADPASAFARLTQPVWDRLAPARVAVLPPDAAFPPPVPGVEIVREVGAALTGQGTTTLLLRPDHYVAAVLDQPEQAASSFAAVLDATWTQQPVAA